MFFASELMSAKVLDGREPNLHCDACQDRLGPRVVELRRHAERPLCTDSERVCLFRELSLPLHGCGDLPVRWRPLFVFAHYSDYHGGLTTYPSLDRPEPELPGVMTYTG